MKIKTKEKTHHINKLDRHQYLKHYQKHSSLKNRQLIQNEHDESAQKPTPQRYAVNTVIDREKSTSTQAVYRGKKLYQSKVKQRQMKNRNKKTHEFNDLPKIVSYKKKPNYKNKNIKKDKLFRKYKNTRNVSSFDNMTQQQKNMKSTYLRNFQQKIQKKGAVPSNIKEKVKHPFQTVKGAGNIVKKTVGGLNKLIGLGTGMLLITVIVLFIGIFAVLGDDSSTNTSLMPLSDEVIAYEETIRKYAKQYDIEDYVPLLQAVMMQESGGKGNDPMQSSECEYNKKYPKVSQG